MLDVCCFFSKKLRYQVSGKHKAEHGILHSVNIAISSLCHNEMPNEEKSLRLKLP